MSDPIIRDAVAGDFPAIASLYAHHVHTGLASFEEVPPSADEMQRRYHHVRARGLPWRVAELHGRVVGYCYASPFNPRSAYRFTVQDSIYVAEDCIGRGVGARLLQPVIDGCTALGYRQMMAVVGDSGNEASLRLHARLGFRTIGQALRVGVKFGRWVDIVYLQRPLGEQTARPPAEDPIGYIAVADQTGP
ncbi:phosphinothricin acetyltransferase [Stella humosa]|uniref:Phosphinothricin acetyltransferase n=1 Tax=Stella humosa TaxID=94 RepID=A0A3N1M264_9PROT|nr:GNAT family N-acetyltransferase [Stella humosa]ROQ01604.1 phosphinothricin acetyltransferase [Stella humosa]BBK31985.1 GCN5 family N-acetyltransferase [Stella humosa]